MKPRRLAYMTPQHTALKRVLTEADAARERVSEYSSEQREELEQYARSVDKSSSVKTKQVSSVHPTAICRS
jgi:hypothetical protein